MVVVLKDELAALRIWQSAKSSGNGLALPDDVWVGMSISMDKIESVLRDAGIDDSPRRGQRSRLRGNS
jgi:hypothetical protein